MHAYLLELPPAPLPVELHDKLASVLPKAGQDAVKRFRLPEDSLRSLVGRLAPIWYLRTQQLVVSGESPVFGRKVKGKPTLVEPALDPQIDFNTSHNGSYVLLGVARGSDCQIGVDLMKFPDDPMDVQEGISEQLSHEERHSLAVPMSDYERSKRLTTLWTYKECFVKATGDGVGFGLERITLTLGPNGEVDGVCVDGSDVRWDGWKYAAGFQKRQVLSTGGGESEEAYGWTVFWRGDDSAWDRKLEIIDWDTFLLAFRNTIA